MQCVEQCDDPNPANHVAYEQPVWQSLNMFIGELGCMYYQSRVCYPKNVPIVALLFSLLAPTTNDFQPLF